MFTFSLMYTQLQQYDSKSCPNEGYDVYAVVCISFSKVYLINWQQDVCCTLI